MWARQILAVSWLVLGLFFSIAALLALVAGYEIEWFITHLIPVVGACVLVAIVAGRRTRWRNKVGVVTSGRTPAFYGVAASVGVLWSFIVGGLSWEIVSLRAFADVHAMYGHMFFSAVSSIPCTWFCAKYWAHGIRVEEKEIAVRVPSGTPADHYWFQIIAIAGTLALLRPESLASSIRESAAFVAALYAVQLVAVYTFTIAVSDMSRRVWAPAGGAV